MIERIQGVHDEQEYLSRAEFEKQLRDTKKLETEHGSVEYAIVEPETLISPRPVVYVGGFAHGRNSYVEEMFDLARSGRKIVYTNPIRGFDKGISENVAALQQKYALPESVRAKVAALDAVIEAVRAGEDVDLVGHSQGGLLITLLGALRPAVVRHIVLQSPEGFQGKLSTPRMMAKFARQAVYQLRDVREQNKQGDPRPARVAARTAGSFTRELARDIFWRLTEEIPGSVRVAIAPVLKDIKTASKDAEKKTVISLLYANSDRLFPPGVYEKGIEMERNLVEAAEPETGGVFDYVDCVAMYARKGAGHNAAANEKEGLLRKVLDQ